MSHPTTGSATAISRTCIGPGADWRPGSDSREMRRPSDRATYGGFEFSGIERLMSDWKSALTTSSSNHWQSRIPQHRVVEVADVTCRAELLFRFTTQFKSARILYTHRSEL